MTRTFLSISAYKLAVRIGYRWGKDAPDECLFVRRSSLSHVTTAFVSSSRADVVIHLENGETHTFAEPTLDVANATAQIISGYVWNDDTAHTCSQAIEHGRQINWTPLPEGLDIGAKRQDRQGLRGARDSRPTPNGGSWR